MMQMRREPGILFEVPTGVLSGTIKRDTDFMCFKNIPLCRGLARSLGFRALASSRFYTAVWRANPDF